MLTKLINREKIGVGRSNRSLFVLLFPSRAGLRTMMKQKEILTVCTKKCLFVFETMKKKIQSILVVILEILNNLQSPTERTVV